MKISLIDRSLYYKGLMLLIRKDREIHDEERKMMMYVGETLGFEPSFCENAIREILDNKYIIDSPPLFTEPSVAVCFIKDGLRLSVSDQQIHKAEIAWLESVAEENGVRALCAGELERFGLKGFAESVESSLELKNFEWE